MKSVTPRHDSAPRAFGKALFFIVGFFYAVWELRVLWRDLAMALRRLRQG